MNKTPIQVVSSSMPPYEEYINEIKSIWDNRWLTHSGPKHQQLEKKLCDYLNVDNVSLFANGHLALEAIMHVMELEGEIITTPYTFASTTQAIMRCGLTPVFCDIDPTTYNIDADKIESLITDKTSAIMPVHVYGNICDYKKIKEIAEKHDLKVIYDAAHAFGITVDGIPVAQIGDAAMFSFHATKVFHTVEGGCLTFNDSEYYKKLAAWRQFGMYGKEDAEILGTNAKMTEFHAAMGICNLRHVNEEIEKRKKVATRYVERLSNIDGLDIFKAQSNTIHNYAYFPVLFDENKFGFNRDEVVDLMAKENIFLRKYFYPLTSEFSICKTMFNIQKTPIAKEISKKVAALPLFADLTLDKVDYICDTLINLKSLSGRR